ncbi:MAG: hypothetical protein WA476_03320 [Acidobacteriaceae bacterium]
MVRPPAIFLRTECLLPDGLHLKTKLFAVAWMYVENVAPAQLDLAVRDAGWHFMWIESACSRVGWGWNDEAAITRAITQALMQTREKFNAVELSVVRVSRYFGLRIAKATVHTRHIQQSASLGLLESLPIQQPA